jgi:hypothetical protein|tara:strand:- start:79 stop:318 length:240 start_codon:yes stop_codon:yes gene_type:complete
MKFGEWVYKELAEIKKSVNWLAGRCGKSHSAFLDYKKTDREPPATVVFLAVRIIAEEKGCAAESLLLKVGRECYDIGEA